MAKKVAVIGSGISGLTSAWLLAPRHDVQIYEAMDWVGGHTHTIAVPDPSGEVPVDTGFIVFNDVTYPHFTRLLKHLRVATELSEMGFSVRCETSGLEYAGSNLKTLFAQKRNLLSSSYWRFLRDIDRFNRTLKAKLIRGELDEDLTLGEFVVAQGFGLEVQRHYIAPITAAIWSAGLQQALTIPLEFFAKFFDNHGLLNRFDRPSWKVVSGGSQRYVDALLPDADFTIHKKTPVVQIYRQEDGISITTERFGTQTFDAVVVATHSDQALRMLAAPSREEERVLGAIQFMDSEVILHTDAAMMPRARRAWSSWNYLLPVNQGSRPTLTYHMNTLQNLRTQTDYFVSLNIAERIAEDKVIDRFTYAHPVVNQDALRARGNRSFFNGDGGVWYCGAYWGNGFHEDGVVSAIDACRGIGADPGRLRILTH